MFRFSTLALLAGAALLSACETDLGPCDDGLARTVYFDSQGTPHYGGQALVSAYCTNGCHSANAEGMARSGVPAELDFDMVVANGDAMALAHLRAGQQNIFDWRGEAQEWVEAQTMPPEGFPRSGVTYTDELGDTLPGLDEQEGQSILRNWLSCGSPVVEKSQSRTGSKSPGMCCGGMDGNLCTSGNGDVGDCRVAQDSEPLEATWPSLYDEYFGSPTCLACHETQAQASAFNTTLVMGATAQTAYDAMVGVMADGAGMCAGETVVIAGDADGSNLVHKLEGEGAGGGALCGSPMPFGGRGAPEPVIQAVREWINAGALAN